MDNKRLIERWESFVGRVLALCGVGLVLAGVVGCAGGVWGWALAGALGVCLLFVGSAFAAVVDLVTAYLFGWFFDDLAESAGYANH